MNEERLNKIKDSIVFQKSIITFGGFDDDLLQEEIELYNEVISLKKQKIVLKDTAEKYKNEANTFRENWLAEIMKSKELKKKISSYENPKDMTLMFMYCDEKAKDKIKELQQENAQLKQKLKESE